jgi:NAD(P) transhydrogenase
MDIQHFDTIIIGSGPGGEGAAMKLAKAGQRVAVIEAYDQL